MQAKTRVAIPITAKVHLLKLIQARQHDQIPRRSIHSRKIREFSRQRDQEVVNPNPAQERQSQKVYLRELNDMLIDIPQVAFGTEQILPSFLPRSDRPKGLLIL